MGINGILAPNNGCLNQTVANNDDLISYLGCLVLNLLAGDLGRLGCLVLFNLYL